MSIHVGVLALQGAFQKHIDILQTSGVSASTVRSADELEDCDALIIPGGEWFSLPSSGVSRSPLLVIKRR